LPHFSFSHYFRKKYSEYKITVDPYQDDKATEIKLCSFARPHMRAFHMAWIGFHMAFFIWFSASPLLSEIREDLGLTKKQIWSTSVIAVGGTILFRFIMGPVCDKVGPRIPFACVLMFCSIPTGLTGLANSFNSLLFIRLLIGIAGCTFVMCQYWTSRMFTKNVVGTANAMVGGWGNLGGGVTQLVVGSLLFPLFKIFYDGDSEKAWRTVCVVPAVITFLVALLILWITEDAPKGNYGDMKRHGVMPDISAAASFRSGALNLNTWILFFQYACCFGVELTMQNAAALYFTDEFGQSTESSAAIASIFGWMNLFARAMGGFSSDWANRKMGMKGRILVHTICLFGEGALVVVFANTQSLVGSICIMICFAICGQAAAGTSFAIVPYVDPTATGSIAGLVGGGGNCGAVAFGMAFRELSYKEAFTIMGFCIIGSAVLSVFIKIKGCSSLLLGGVDDRPAKKDSTLSVPEPQKDAA
jgi:NNP family nitrate/nitrite transporter-like MFS transporter